jgi:carbon-monoxide dehydrogenase medium subunit
MDFNTISPKSKKELLEAINSCQDKNFRFGAGYTDIINELNIHPQQNLVLINLAQLIDEDFNGITINEKGVRIGALTTANELLKNDIIKSNFQVLWEATNSVASTQIRETATIGGNICQASPSGDMSCAMVSLKAICEIMDSDGKIREEPISSFFKGVKKTSLSKKEILRSIFIPANKNTNTKSGYIKIGTRLSMEISIISIGYHFQLDENNVITNAGLAIGAVAPTIKFTEDACNKIIGKKIDTINSSDIEFFANLVKNHASPISDVRATAWYRTEVLFNSTKAIFE